MLKSLFMVFAVVISLAFISPVHADNLSEDAAKMATISAKLDAGEITLTKALADAIQQDVSFDLIVAFCRERGVSLVELVSIAQLTGMQKDVVENKLAAAGVSKQEMTITTTSTQGLGYTPASTNRQQVVTVRPVTSNPGGSAQGGSVSQSSL